MKRYLIFHGAAHYPNGGFLDKHFWADDLIEAEHKLFGIEDQWAHAVDTTTWQRVENWSRPYGGAEWKRFGAQ